MISCDKCGMLCTIEAPTNPQPTPPIDLSNPTTYIGLSNNTRTSKHTHCSSSRHIGHERKGPLKVESLREPRVFSSFSFVLRCANDNLRFYLSVWWTNDVLHTECSSNILCIFCGMKQLFQVYKLRFSSFRSMFY